MTVVAIDPGHVASAYVRIDRALRPLEFGKAPNADVLIWLTNAGEEFHDGATYAIEMVESFGMAVGAEVFHTCVWIGRFAHAVDVATDQCAEALLVPRTDMKLHLCHSRRAKDPNITQALIDRFAPGEPNRGKGTKAAPGWFYGFAADVWQAYALAVTVADRLEVLAS